VTGQGAAGKTQVANMIKAVLSLPQAPDPDAGDALALALCHAHCCRGIQLTPPKQI
jgi:crossover junction endodeoxyribonuclease RuvC